MGRGKERDIESDENRHYSERGGHHLRSQYWKFVDSLRSHHMRFVPVEVPVLARQEQLRIRRNMRRTPYDGRR